jgi:phosphomannomutase
MLRASGTEPLFRVYSEAQSPRAVEQRLLALEELVEIGAESG